MKHKYFFRAILLIGITIFCFVRNTADCQGRPKLKDLADQAENILKVKTLSKQSMWKSGSGGRNIVTKYNLQVQDQIKGSITENTIILEIRGGQIGDTIQHVSTSVHMDINEEAIIFLKRNPYRVVGGFHGKIKDYNGSVFIDDKEVETNRLIQVLKASKKDSSAISSFLKELDESSDLSKNSAIAPAHGEKEAIESGSSRKVSGEKKIKIRT